MITYTKEEILPSSVISKNFGGILDQLRKKKLKKVAVIRNNKMEAIIIPINEYEFIKQASDYLERLDIYNKVKDRMKDPIENAIPFEDILKELGINKDEL